MILTWPNFLLKTVLSKNTLSATTSLSMMKGRIKRTRRRKSQLNTMAGLKLRWTNTFQACGTTSCPREKSLPQHVVHLKRPHSTTEGHLKPRVQRNADVLSRKNVMRGSCIVLQRTPFKSIPIGDSNVSLTMHTASLVVNPDTTQS